MPDKHIDIDLLISYFQYIVALDNKDPHAVLQLCNEIIFKNETKLLNGELSLAVEKLKEIIVPTKKKYSHKDAIENVIKELKITRIRAFL